MGGICLKKSLKGAGAPPEPGPNGTGAKFLARSENMSQRRKSRAAAHDRWEPIGVGGAGGCALLRGKAIPNGARLPPERAPRPGRREGHAPTGSGARATIGGRPRYWPIV